MKKATKLVSGVLAALMATSAFTATGFAAAKTPTKEDCDAAGEQKIYFQFPTDGTWGDHNAVKVSGMTGKGNVYCLIYAVYGNEYEFFNSGWETSVCSCTAEDKDAGLYSYDINSKMTVTLDEIDPATNKKKKVTLYRFMEMNPDVDYGVIFSTSANGGFQTADLNMTSECIGDTVQLVSPIQTRENAANSNKSDYYSEWKNHKDYKLMANITSTGKFVDGQFPAHQPPAQMLSNKLKEYLTNYINVGYFNKPEKNAAICEKLGVTPKQVYDQYMADNAEFIEGATIYPGQPDDKIATTDDAPVDFIKYMGKDDKGQPKEKKMPAPEAVRTALGVTDEPTTAEPTTAEPTTVAPTTAEPTTAEPTTAEPTTVEPTTAAPAEDVYVLAGSSDWLTTGWDPAIDAYVMEKQDDGTYAITVPEVEAGENNYAVKVVKFVGGDEAQKEWYGVNGGNLNYDFMVKTACDVTVTFNPETKEITVTGIGVAEPEYPINKLVAVGSGQNGFLNDESWAVDSEANAMTEKSEGVYEIVFDEVGANAEYQVKFAANGSWGMNWGLVKGTEAAIGTPNPAQYNAEDNIVFTPESEDEYVKITLTLDLSAWDKVTKEGATYTIKVEPVDEPTGPIMGDVNGDGKVDIADATAIQYASIDLPTEGAFNADLADVNGDGRISILDATCVQKYVAGYTKGIGNAGKVVNPV